MQFPGLGTPEQVTQIYIKYKILTFGFIDKLGFSEMVVVGSNPVSCLTKPLVLNVVIEEMQLGTLIADLLTSNIH